MRQIWAQMRRPRWALREAGSEDVDELAALYEACMRGYAEQYHPWDSHQFKDTFIPGTVEIVEVRRELAGLLKTIVCEEYLYLADIQLVEAWRNRGIGTGLIEHTMDRARVLNLPVRLRVLRNNPARSLYERLGFEEVGEGAIDWILENREATRSRS